MNSGTKLHLDKVSVKDDFGAAQFLCTKFGLKLHNFVQVKYRTGETPAEDEKPERFYFSALKDDSVVFISRHKNSGRGFDNSGDHLIYIAIHADSKGIKQCLMIKRDKDKKTVAGFEPNQITGKQRKLWRASTATARIHAPQYIPEGITGNFKSSLERIFLPAFEAAGDRIKHVPEWLKKREGMFFQPVALPEDGKIPLQQTLNHPFLQKTCKAFSVLKRIPDHEFMDLGTKTITRDDSKVLANYSKAEIADEGRLAMLNQIYNSAHHHLRGRVLGLMESIAVLICGPEIFSSQNPHDRQHNYQQEVTAGFNGLTLEKLKLMLAQPHFMGVITYPLGVLALQQEAKIRGMDFTAEHLVQAAGIENAVSLFRHANSASQLLDVNRSNIEGLLDLARQKQAPVLLPKGREIAAYAHEGHHGLLHIRRMAASPTAQGKIIEISRKYGTDGFSSTHNSPTLLKKAANHATRASRPPVDVKPAL